MKQLILGSGSIGRLKLLKQINFIPDLVIPANIDETPKKKEKPLDYVNRMAETKAEALNEKYFGNIILAADTIINYQSRIIQKPQSKDEIIELLKFYSNKNIKTITSIYTIAADFKRAKKTVETTIKFKNINQRDINEYLEDGYSLKTAGGIVIESIMEAFVLRIIGSYSNIIGLPLYETRNMLISIGAKTKL